jgi:peptidoglycan/LPS O-acetylase OafA/YrhL
MGVLRFLPALSVAWTHAGLPKRLSGDLCVTVFFVISGFYMAMVLSENPACGKISAFYQQRLLRLFPTYSYPLYLCHMLVFELWDLLKWSSPWSGYLMIATATALAVLLMVAVDKPVDRFRYGLLRAK